jgi:hypothetical protein
MEETLIIEKLQTLANMEAALERTCKALSLAAEEHHARMAASSPDRRAAIPRRLRRSRWRPIIGGMILPGAGHRGGARHCTTSWPRAG